MVVSVQEHLTSPEPKVSDATNFQEEDTDEDPPDIIYNNSEESYDYHRKTLKSTRPSWTFEPRLKWLIINSKIPLAI